MSLRLILMRHAKSDWHLTLPDHALPLNNRGHRAASALGEWLSRNGYVPNEIISSTAARTLETCARLNLGTLPRTTRDLYLASHDTLLYALRSATGQTVLVLGHNPGICALANGLLNTQPAHRRFGDYPSGATLAVQFDQPKWRDINWGTGTPRAFVTPADVSL